MTKYLVTVEYIAYAYYAVEAESEEQAINVASSMFHSHAPEAEVPGLFRYPRTSSNIHADPIYLSRE